ncbi:MAG: hypothetical protein AABX60_03915, partial [Nanoarchaeota archaeon]
LVDEQEESRVVLMMQQGSPERFLRISEINPKHLSEVDAFNTDTATIEQHLPSTVTQQKQGHNFTS